MSPAPLNSVASPSGASFAARPPAGEALLQRQQVFASALSGARQGAAGADDSPEGKARAAAEEFVSMALVQPILKQMREANQAPPPFGPGQGEKNFGHIVDAQVARGIVQSSNFGVVGAIQQQLLARLSPARTAEVLSPPLQAPPDAEVAS